MIFILDENPWNVEKQYRVLESKYVAFEEDGIEE